MPVLYLALLPVWFFALDGLTLFAATFAHFIYHFFDPQTVISPEGTTVKVIVIATQQSGFGGQTHSSAVRIDTITYGLPMLAALVIATRADSVRAKVRAFIAGLLAMTIMTVPAIMMWAKLTSLELDDLIEQATVSGWGNRSLYYVFHGYAFSQPIVVVGVWFSLMMFGLFRENSKRGLRAKSTPRNAPCPCASGRKHKRCCGRGE